MNVQHTQSSETLRHTFVVELKDGGEKKKYDVVIYTNSKGKFIDEEISYSNSGEELDFEGMEGDIREKITDYLAENWDTLVKS